jgi:putative ATPase
MQHDLFSNKEDNTKISPLAYKLRPKIRSDYVGLEELEKQYPFLQSHTPKSMIIWGPPGTGKTTLVDIICQSEDVELFKFSAVLSGLPELKKIFQSALHIISMQRKTPVIFIDEIHRFNKAQQDALLPHVESGKFVLIGATTENPRSSINRALLSRLQLVELKSIDYNTTIKIIKLAISRIGDQFDDKVIELMAEYSNGDARKAIGGLETAINLRHQDEYSFSKLKEIIKENSRAYDRNQDRHYDVISAFIKSLRGSDPDAAILWLAVMLDGGEDPVFIARRLVIFASEDIGNADINALTIANNTLNIVSNIGMPESRITLAQATTYLASTVKSNAAYKAINEALKYVESLPTIEVPEHLKNFPMKDHEVKYKYPHEFINGWVDQEYTVQKIPQFYRPKEIGSEKKIRTRLKELWSKKKYD